jgi:hypothetical protein
MTRLNLLLGTQIVAILTALAGELLASQPLVTAAIGVFAIAVIVTFAQMTGSLLSGLVGSTTPDMSAEYRR